MEQIKRKSDYYVLLGGYNELFSGRDFLRRFQRLVMCKFLEPFGIYIGIYRLDFIY